MNNGFKYLIKSKSFKFLKNLKNKNHLKAFKKNNKNSLVILIFLVRKYFFIGLYAELS